MQVINPSPSMGANIGSAVGQGLGAGLQTLANYKLQQVQDNNVYNYLKSANPNMPKEQAYAISKMPADLRAQVIKGQGGGLEGLAALMAERYGTDSPAPATSAQSPVIGQPARPSYTPQQMQAAAQRYAPAQAMAQVATNVPAEQKNRMQQMFQAPQAAAAPAVSKEALAQEYGTKAFSQGVPKDKLFNALKTIKDPKIMGLAMKAFDGAEKANLATAKLDETKRHNATQEGIQARRVTTGEKRQAEMEKFHDETIGIRKGQLGLGKERLSQKTDKDKWTYNSKYITRINNRATAAEENKWRWTVMRELYKSPNLISPTAYKGLEHIGMNTGDWIGNEGELLVKLTSDFKKNISLLSSTNGGVVPVSEFKALEQAIPTVLNSPDGGIKLTRLIENAERLDLKAAELVKEITEKNGKVPPYDLQSQVLEKLKPMVDSVKKEALDIAKGISLPGDTVSKISDVLKNPVGTYSDDGKGGIIIVDINNKTHKKYARKATPQEEKEARALSASLDQ